MEGSPQSRPAFRHGLVSAGLSGYRRQWPEPPFALRSVRFQGRSASPRILSCTGPETPTEDNMKNIFLLAVGLTVLSACSDDAVPQPDATQADASVVAADASMEPSAIPECPKAFYSPLPDSAIHFDFPFQIARDRVYTDRKSTRLNSSH